MKHTNALESALLELITNRPLKGQPKSKEKRRQEEKMSF